MKHKVQGNCCLGKHQKTIQSILNGKSDAAIRFTDIVSLLNHLDFEMRIRGDHHIFTRHGVEEILNLQPQGAMAKAYQVKQIRDLLVKYTLGADDNE